MSRFVRWHISGCLLWLLVTSIPLLSQTTNDDDTLRTNASLFRLELSRFTDSLVNHSSVLRGSSALFTIHVSDEHALVEQEVISGLTRNGCTVYLDSGKESGVYSVLLNGVDLAVRYNEPFNERMFGESKSARVVSMLVPYTLVERQSGKVLKSETINESFTDTIATSDIPQLEQQLIPSSMAPLPERSFFDKLLEPLIIIGSTGVAIFLFFHIRS